MTEEQIERRLLEPFARFEDELRDVRLAIAAAIGISEARLERILLALGRAAQFVERIRRRRR